jgi:glycosyltransferase involved in cell wall biosynthesis
MHSEALPQVSVVIPTYNRADCVARCLDALVAQTFKDFEVLICDDGSTDGTPEVVNRYRGSLKLSYHWRKNFGGPARPRNLGLSLARGDYIALLDSDDWWAPRKLAESVARLDAGADLVYHDLLVARSSAQRLYMTRRRTRPLAAPVFDDLFRYGNGICNSSVVVRRELLRRVGGFSEDPTMVAWEDYDAWLRIARVTERFERIPRPLGYYWAGGDNISSPQRLISNLERFREIYLEPGSPTRHPPAWYHYLLGRANYQLGNHSTVLSEMRQALGAGLPAPQVLRAALIGALSSLRLLVAAMRGRPV